MTVLFVSLLTLDKFDRKFVTSRARRNILLFVWIWKKKGRKSLHCHTPPQQPSPNWGQDSGVMALFLLLLIALVFSHKISIPSSLKKVFFFFKFQYHLILNDRSEVFSDVKKETWSTSITIKISMLRIVYSKSLPWF